MTTSAETEVGPLLSSVSVMLAAYGVFYTTQRDRIDRAIDDKNIPANQVDIGSARNEVSKCRRVAAALALAALTVWLLLLGEIVHRIGDALDANLSLDDYSTPDAIFFVAANAWLLLAIYLGLRWQKLSARYTELGKHLTPSGQ